MKQNERVVFSKVVRPGKIMNWSGKRRINVFCKIQITDLGNLSISGVEGPRQSGNCEGSCGQIDMSPKEWAELGKGWDVNMLKTFFNIWKRWHLNDMRSGCEHQRALGWTYEEHHGIWVEDKSKASMVDEYDTGETPMKWDAYRGHPCPTCDYEIGSKWLHEDLPQDVIDFLKSLPDTDITPAWV